MLLVLDWDETLTSHDTLSLIPEQHNGGLKPYVQPYLDDLAEHTSTHPLGKDEDRTSLEQQLDWLASLSDVEGKSVQRVTEGGAFIGWDHTKLDDRLDQISFHPGVQTDLSSWLEQRRGITTNVLSVSWSKAFIQAGLRRAKLPTSAVYANDVEVDSETGKGTGKVIRKIATGTDKLREMGKMVDEAGKATMIVYAGDSNTDLPCLLAASVGIVVAPNEGSGVIKTIQRLGYGESLANGCEDFEARLRTRAPLATKPSDTDRQALLAKSRSDVWLVRVKDWVEGTRVLEAVERVELDQAAMERSAGVALA
ncbi:hypothetical protein BDZ90DRAFT_232068 [Jaminaea rosea]|uniref:HAD-like protein n=1 Tax=Jaminaea rosea TaxID=1569628 RepID=A0A316UQQ6_9BASI|nr:hypothetical protein BDZ90DRAFT_232068 [Jaminaea rosea]PWN27649.1 hypothetical protein BDZ90DRAFT_232068 [Jaminaea rosea]